MLLHIVEAVDGPSSPYECREIRRQGRGALPDEECRSPCVLAEKMAEAHDAWRRSPATTSLRDHRRPALLGPITHPPAPDRDAVVPSCPASAAPPQLAQHTGTGGAGPAPCAAAASTGTAAGAPSDGRRPGAQPSSQSPTTADGA
ncbi:hypothetical protein [Streptomyces qinglanensis]|uniref:hypothetical protein n=1 Tax=Streptomyces qinglanensis TaxID=943816 RepID=UPI003D74801D